MVKGAISNYDETVDTIKNKEKGKLLYIRSIITVKDCKVYHFPKSHSVRTQYREEKSWKTPLKIKFEKRGERKR